MASVTPPPVLTTPVNNKKKKRKRPKPPKTKKKNKNKNKKKNKKGKGVANSKAASTDKVKQWILIEAKLQGNKLKATTDPIKNYY